MSHTPWTQEQAEKWARDFALTEADDYANAFEGFLAGMAKAAEVIEACETIKYTLRDGKPHTGSYEVWKAKLVGVRPIVDSDESGSGR